MTPSTTITEARHPTDKLFPVCVMRVSSLPCTFRKLAAGLSPFILMGKINVITDRADSFIPYSHHSHSKSGTHFSQAISLLNISTLKCLCSDKKKKKSGEKNYVRELCLNKALLRDLGICLNVSNGLS